MFLVLTCSVLLIVGSKDRSEGDTEKGDWPLSAGWGCHSSYKLQEAVYIVNEGILAHELLLALQVLLALLFLAACRTTRQLERQKCSYEVAPSDIWLHNTQGIVPAILRLKTGRFRTETLSNASLCNLLQPSICSGANAHHH